MATQNSYPTSFTLVIHYRARNAVPSGQSFGPKILGISLTAIANTLDICVHAVAVANNMDDTPYIDFGAQACGSDHTVYFRFGCPSPEVALERQPSVLTAAKAQTTQLLSSRMALRFFPSIM